MALRFQNGRSLPIGQITKPNNVTDAEWNQLTDTGKRAVFSGKAPSPPGRGFKDAMYHAMEIREVVRELRPLASRFPKVRAALQAAEQAQQAVTRAMEAVNQSVIWD